MSSLKEELTKGVFWIALAKYSGILVSLIITAILARNVSPTAFGTMAIATVIMAFLDIFSDMGLGVAIVQFKDLTSRQLQSLYSISIGLAVSLTLLLFIFSGTIASYYDDPVLSSIIKCLCICLFFKALNIIPNGLMLKSKRFKDIAIRTLVFQILSGAIACWMALTGLGIYSLLASPVISSIGVFAYNFYNYPQSPTWPIDMRVVKRIWKYSVYQFLFTIINYFSRNIDTLIIGKYLSMKQLGYYEKSYRLMQLPIQNITFVITPVLHPILSSLQDNKGELSNKNIRLTQLLSRVSFPLGIFLYFCASPIILIIFGDKWISAIPVFKILALSVPLQVMLSTSGSIFQAAGQTKYLFFCGIQSSICTVGAFILAVCIYHTIEAMAWAWVIAAVTNFFFAYWIMNTIIFKTSFWKFIKAIIPQIFNSLVVLILIFAFVKIWWPISTILQILWILLLTIVPTILMGVLLQQYTINDLYKILKRKNQSI